MTTIKATELRIGNWVSGVNSYKKIDHLDIRDVAENRLIVPFIPIPLTEQILLKAGFKRFINKLEYDYIKDKFGISFDFEDKDYFIFGIDVKFPEHSFKYLHQLQNLYFALTGEELNIEL